MKKKYTAKFLGKKNPNYHTLSSRIGNFVLEIPAISKIEAEKYAKKIAKAHGYEFKGIK